MSTPRRPSLVNRALSTPPPTPNLSSSTAMNTPIKQQTYHSTSHLTPPTSPRDSRLSPTNTDIATYSPTPQSQTLSTDQKLRHGHLEPLHTDILSTTSRQPPPASEALECPFKIEILKDDRGRDAYFGSGAWSIVLKATTHKKQQNSPTTQFGHGGLSRTITPPHSPIQTNPILVAVKKPNRRDATEILRSEAKTLGYLQTLPDSERFVVPFYGVIDHSTLVLGAIPYSLEDHIRKRASEQASNWTSTEPVLGSTTCWLDLAHKLTTALAWLHTEAGVVHGDLKPGNVLLSPVPSSSNNQPDPESSFPYAPILTDFSSSQLLPTPQTPHPPLTPNTLSAITREYTAPELLSSSVLRDPSSTATRATDVFSLAVTLLVAATGQLLVYPGSVFQRQAMATQGWGVLGLVRNGDGGLRVPRGGVVERVLESAVRRRPEERVDAEECVRLVERVAGGVNGVEAGRL
ncbi:hypothetical protein LTR84_011756 [Exophiala bonariae]|uniref:Protein kinase domain-containing protein n=1 Tax=Exophiala bonariae TaxID=1690606 RepID=A0AAV9NIG8_9EURO|nr:hypothetical protein LTR84_011756 [Exophiala bonariae]